MAKKPTVTTVSSGYASNTQLNNNFTALRDAFDNTLSLDGSTPNAMQADLDLNGNALLNVGSIDADNLTLNGQTVTELSSVPEWRSTWMTGTSYAKNDLVSEAGSAYICLVAHTSGTFSTDLTALKWELFAQKGAAGAGTGDMVGSNNLSDVTNVATARSNLGLGTVATESTVPVVKGGTGANSAATARSNLGLVIGTNVQAYGATLTSLEGLSLVQGDILYATAADTLARLPKGTARQVVRMNSGATAPEFGDAGTRGTAVASTSGTTIDFTSLPSGIQRLVVMFTGVSVSGTSNFLIQLGDSSGFYLSGYISCSSNSSTFTALNSTSGFVSLGQNSAPATYSGAFTFDRIAANNFTCTSLLASPSPVVMTCSGAGRLNMGSNDLDRVRITTVGGADTFDAGTINIKWEY